MGAIIAAKKTMSMDLAGAIVLHDRRGVRTSPTPR